MKFKHVPFDIIQIFCFKFTLITLIFTSFIMFKINVLVQIVLCLAAETNLINKNLIIIRTCILFK